MPAPSSFGPISDQVPGTGITSAMPISGTTTSIRSKSSEIKPAASSSSAIRAGSATAGPSASTSDRASSNSKYGTGALAGGIVGAFVGGCLLAFLVALFFFRKCRNKETPSHAAQNAHPTSRPTGKEEAAIVTGPISHTMNISHCTKDTFDASGAFAATAFQLPYIPPAADDGTVSMKIESLLDQISLHVDTYYARPSSNTSISASRLDAIGHYDSSLLPGSLSSFLSNRMTQRAALTQTLAFLLLEAISPGSVSGSLLPPYFRWTPPTTQIAPSERSTEEYFAFVWRMLVSHFQTCEPSKSPSPQDETFKSIAKDFTTTFSPYSNLDFCESDRISHLISVMKATSNLGIWLFSQPCAFQFDWESSRDDNVLIISPSVWKICDEEGRRLEIAQKLVEKRIIRV